MIRTHKYTNTRKYRLKITKDMVIRLRIVAILYAPSQLLYLKKWKILRKQAEANQKLAFLWNLLPMTAYALELVLPQTYDV